MRVTVYYPDPDNPGALVAMAEITAEVQGAEDALEYAYARTQNVEGSWSRHQWADDARNWDWSPDVRVLHPNRRLNGVEYGHRSSMVGDVMAIEGRRWRVANIGFEPITEEA